MRFIGIFLTNDAEAFSGGEMHLAFILSENGAQKYLNQSTVKAFKWIYMYLYEVIHKERLCTFF